MKFGYLLIILAIPAVVCVKLARDKVRRAKSPVLQDSAAQSPSTSPAYSIGLGLFVIALAPALIGFASLTQPDLSAAEARAFGPAQSAQTKPAIPARSILNILYQLQYQVRKEPSNTDAWRELGWAYMHVRQPQNAVQAYRQAIALRPRDTELRSALAEAQIQAGTGLITPAVYADLRGVADENPNDARARFYLALYKDQQGDHAGAIADWRQMLQSAPQDAAWGSEIRRVIIEVAKEQHIAIPLPKGAP